MFACPEVFADICGHEVLADALGNPKPFSGLRIVRNKLHQTVLLA